MHLDSAKPPFTVGDRVFNKLGRRHGTVLALPAEGHGVPSDLYRVLDDEGELRAVHPTVLQPTGEADGLQIAMQRLHEKREVLFHDMLCTIAASRRANLSDPKVRAQIEAEVKQMSGSWGDGEKVRRKEFENPELRKRLIGSLVTYLETGDLIQQVIELIDGDGDSAPCVPGTAPA